MRRPSTLRWPASLAAATFVLAAGAAATAAQESTDATKVRDVVGHGAAASADALSLTFDLSSGERLEIDLQQGVVRVNGRDVARYDVGGEFEQALRGVVEHIGSVGTPEAVDAVRGLDEVHVETAAEAARAAVVSALARLESAGAVVPDVPDAPAPRLQPEARRNAADRRARAVASTGVFAPAAGTSLVGGMVAAALDLGAVFVAMSFIGLGMLIFAPRQLEIVSDTVWHSFGRSFLAGLFAQPLLLPVFGMMIAGLALTVVGILVIPFAIAAFLAAFLLAAVGGFIAVARTIGEVYLRRKMATGEAIPSWGSFRYILYGLAGVSSLWMPAVLLGRVPVAGALLIGTAGAITWALATAGFGAAILSRGGLRGTFVRKLDLALTDEHYWTADGMPSPYRTREPQRR